MRVGVARVPPPSAISQGERTFNRSALVIGGGLAGMTSALSIADEGYDVFLDRKDRQTGRKPAQPAPYRRGTNPQRLLHSLVKRVHSHERIALYYNTEVIGFEGHVGNFRPD